MGRQGSVWFRFMVRDYNYALRQIRIGLDLLVGVVAFFLAYLFKKYGPWYYIHPTLFPYETTLRQVLLILVLVPVATVLALAHNKFYTSTRIYSLATIARQAAVSCFEGMVVCYAVLAIAGRLVNPPYYPSRGMVVLTAVFYFFLLLAKSLMLGRILKRLRQRGRNVRTLLLVGNGGPVKEFIQVVSSHPLWGFRIEGIVSDKLTAPNDETVEGVPVLGSLPQLFNVVQSRAIDEVIFLPCYITLDDLSPYLEGCEEMGVRASLSLNFYQPSIAKPLFERVKDIPLVCYSPTKEMNLALMFKYTFDRIAAAILLVIASPIMALTSLAIKLTSKRGEPVFFGQTRVGLNGRLFKLWKFRSMCVDADKDLEKLRAMSEVDGPVFKMRDDPRITPIGGFLRRWSIDELPQLFNVLRGEMSLVGPRPPTAPEVAQYDRWQRRRLSMKPGITCLWQVSGRSKLSFETWVKLDLQYIDNWSLLLDFKILLRTVVAVLKHEGAM
ncbi:sugar transferase [Candidatus Sumerlaeota bacterium]|nr:sugar transferase [Candidatus Sumerlaeota bacterium]